MDTQTAARFDGRWWAGSCLQSLHAKGAGVPARSLGQASKVKAIGSIGGARNA